jgi:glycine cleavage system H protein
MSVETKFGTSARKAWTISGKDVIFIKASAEIYAPAGGKVIAVNTDLPDKPEAINSDPFGEAWMVQLEGGSAGDVMDAAAYEKHCEERDH